MSAKSVEHIKTEESIRPYIFVNISDDGKYPISTRYVLYWYPRVEAVLSPLTESTLLATISVTGILAINRLILVCFPLHAKRFCTMRRIRIYLVIGIAFAFIYNIPFWINLELKNTVYNGTSFSYVKRKNKDVQSLYQKWLRPIVYFAVPFVLHAVITIMLWIKMKALDKRREQLAKEQRLSNKVTRVLKVVLWVFLACSVPWPVYLVSRFSGVSQYYLRYMRASLYVLHGLNSSVNFIIYTLLNKTYRKIMLTYRCSFTCKPCTRTVTCPMPHEDIKDLPDVYRVLHM